jgi:isocitrate dehydrogenase kinase/phosphatase
MTQELAGRTAAAIFAAFEDYNQTFRTITRRAERRFVEREWKLGQRDAVERIELYDRRVEKCLAELVGRLGVHVAHLDMWREIKSAFASIVADFPDRKFDATFYNSLTRKVFQTVGVLDDVEFTSVADEAREAHSAPQPGELPMRRPPPDVSLEAAIAHLLAELPWAGSLRDAPASARFIAGEIAAVLAARGWPFDGVQVELLGPIFYRATRAFLVGRVECGAGALPLVIAFAHPEGGITADAVMMSEYEVRPLFGFSRSYFHADLPAVEPAIQYLSSIMPGKPIDEIYTVLGRAKQGKTERYRNLFRHLARSSDTFVHAEGIPGMVMIVFTLASYHLVFKVIRDRFAEPKTATRAEVMEKYQFVFQHDRVGRLVDAQEFRRLRFPKSRFAPELLDELLSAAGATCRLEGDDLIIEHCYLERRMKPLDVYLREATPGAAKRAIRDYGQAIRDLALSNVFPGDLLLKNFGVSRHGRVVFYDYDELCLVTECNFRDLPQARDDEDEMRAEPWFYVGNHDVFPEQFLEFLGLRGELREEFMAHHADLLTADFWRELKSSHREERYLEVVPYTRRRAAVAS